MGVPCGIVVLYATVHSDSRIALITAAAAVLGALVGGGATYLSSKSVLDRQLGREERREHERARGVARVYAEQDIDAAAILAGAKLRQQWPVQSERVYFELPALEDRRLVEGRLSLKSAAAVTTGDTVVRAVTVELQTRSGQPLGPSGNALLSEYEASLTRAAEALGELGAN